MESVKPLHQFTALTKCNFGGRTLTRQMLGRAGELLVCLDFLKLGFAASIDGFPDSACDVIADLGGKFLRVQVKTTGKPRIYGGKCATGYSFKWLERAKVRYTDIDLMAFVAFDIGKVIYVPYQKILDERRSNQFSLASHKFESQGGNLFQLLRDYL